MKGKTIAFLVLSAFIYGLFLFIGPRDFVIAESEHKVTICHATASETNPYNEISVDKNSTAQGHDSHSGDIIPPFTYYEWGKVVPTEWVCPKGYSPSSITCPGKCYKDSQPGNASKCENKIEREDWIPYNYLGLNYDALGQAILANNCVIPPAEEDCPTTCGYAGGTVSDGLGGLKACPATDTCPVEEECSTTCGYAGGTVSDGQGGLKTCPATEECEEPEMCKWDDKLEANDPKCPKDCEYDSTISENDDLCIPIDDGEDTEGVTDEVKDTGVVLGATGPEDNLDIYLVELLLVAISISSYVFLSKKYLKNSR